MAQAATARVAAGQLTRKAAERLLDEQLAASCPSCRRTYGEALALLYGPLPGTPRVLSSWPGSRGEAGLGLAPESHDNRISRRRPDGDLRLRLAHHYVGVLKQRQSWVVRREMVAQQWFHYRGAEIGRVLLNEARAALPGQPEESDRWADLAVLALHGKRESSYPDPAERTVQALRARLFQANAARCRGELTSAEQDFDLALQAAEDLKLRDLAFWAEAKSFLASLRRDQRDFRAATREARAGAALFQAAGLAREEALTQWQMASIREQAGDYETALTAIRQALPQALALPCPRLEFDFRHFEAFTLARLGRFEEAAILYEVLTPLYAAHPDKNMLRYWLRALLESGQGAAAAAESSFAFVRDGFLLRKNVYDAALVTLDWTLHLLDAGRPAEVVPLALSMGQAFEALGVARETLASWSLLTEAAQKLELERSEAAAWIEVLDFERVTSRTR